MTDLFASAGVDVPEGGSNRYAERERARKLLAKVEDLTATVDGSYHGKAERAEAYARDIGAHSVARAIRWGVSEPAYSRHGGFFCDQRMERVARNYLQRKEEAR